MVRDFTSDYGCSCRLFYSGCVTANLFPMFMSVSSALFNNNVTTGRYPTGGIRMLLNKSHLESMLDFILTTMSANCYVSGG